MDLSREDETMLAEIREAFAGVTRECGVSWSESVVLDDSMDDDKRARAAARARDVDTSWRQLLDDPNWRADMGVGGLTFLDPIGYRYYLPALMCAEIMGRDNYLSSSLLLSKYQPFKRMSLEQWSLLNDRQKICVRHFLEHVIRKIREQGYDEFEARDWIDALVSYWRDQSGVS
jgi:hypothetical protein